MMSKFHQGSSHSPNPQWLSVEKFEVGVESEAVAAPVVSCFTIDAAFESPGIEYPLDIKLELETVVVVPAPSIGIVNIRET